VDKKILGKYPLKKAGSKKTNSKKSRRSPQKRIKKITVKDRMPLLFCAIILIALSALVSITLILTRPPQFDKALSVATETLVSPPEVVSALPEQAAPVTKPASVSTAVPVTEIRPSPSPKPSVPLPSPAVKSEPSLPGGAASVPSPAKPAPAPQSAPAVKPLSPASAAHPVARPAAQAPQRPEPGPRRGTLVFVIDDAGNNLRELEPFLRFPGPLTIAVLPGLPYSAEAARRIRAAGKEVFLHQPMEAVGGQNPGPGAILMGMNAAMVREVLARNLAEIGPVAGMNNHQGSRVTMDQGMMEIVLALCREHGIYFLDSRTIADTAAPAAAKRMGLKIGERDVFLDNIQEKASMIRYVGEGLQKAQRTGAAIMIGHTWSNELAATLEELYPELIEQGYSLSTISRFMMGLDNENWD
jgi:polysaccharide deacetylase 2 family uncharacterized protein YibQ